MIGLSAETGVRILVVSATEPTATARELLERDIEKRVAIVKWDGPSDDANLEETLLQLLPRSK